ncbi:MAG: dihydrolipoyl dehydrogenase [Clostridiales Family XIII bacterium]|jgi:dihydrolipoamide dehydrogenase|nr:dihydrolipoyl dehydrogenase [Clostridiales Family XIII bacterium]
MEIVVMPKLGFNMDEGKLVAWYKAEGDPVKKGEPLFSIETDKTAIDVEATQDGVVRKLLIGEGDVVAVTLPIAVVGGAEEDVAGAIAEAEAKLASLKQSDFPAASPGIATALPNANAAGIPQQGLDLGVGNPDYEFDVFVVGGGPGGYVAAIRGAQLGLRVALAEKDRVGGVCLNRGCIPTKTLLRSLEALDAVKDAAEFGVAGLDAKKAALDMKKVQARKKAVVDGLVGGVEGLLKKNKVTVFKGEAVLKDGHTVAVGGQDYQTATVVLATGSEVKGLPDGVIQSKKVWTSDTLLSAEKLPKEIVIIGGGVIGVEFAYFLNGAGVKVTVVEFLDRILPPVDAEIAKRVRRDLEKAGIAIHTDAKVTKVTDAAVEFEKGGKTEVLKTKDVLVAVGRAPVVPPEAEALGIAVERGAIVTDERLRTSVPGVYAIGDCNGKTMLAHKASAEGIVAVENIAGQGGVMDYAAIPSAIYIRPEVASVGLSEEDAKARYGAVKVGKFLMLANGKSKVEGDGRGVVKIVADAQYGEILGVHLYCLHATDMIAEAVTAMRAEATVEELARAIHPHPTVSEAVMEAADAVLGSAIHC